ncbi:hypothetical protein Ae168Ps1_1059c [Pseudonocardia sp. Ae168_Ps1]|nr:hypothetical protein Ae150APs1_1060c [Pseudonocardia sp. Ae150A_Ps1]OLL78653.1 hypothetical protein Ae168Ps1_1059c [Pseudonocardia sp. Ae168_Ps1]OLL87218.1 hypothetical protein Ae263Ps1_4273 [Pseudonocardia sp. Ae263_Ps1]OLL92752.1 hypothetical protein Ae356Ps1_2649c [Pseudonocardia sp. Ae356_Ps1]
MSESVDQGVVSERVAGSACCPRRSAWGDDEPTSRRADGPTDRRTDGPTSRRTDEPTDRRTGREGSGHPGAR